MDTAQQSAAVEAVVTSYNQGPLILEALDSPVPSDGAAGPHPSGGRRLDRPGLPCHTGRDRSGPRAGAGPGDPAAQRRRLGRPEHRHPRRPGRPVVLVLDGGRPAAPRLPRKKPARCWPPALPWRRPPPGCKTFGVLDAVVRPSGGGLTAFLSRNSCPATHLLRRSAWEQCGGYDETMRSGFEDWELFLRLLETRPDAQIGIVPEPLLEYRTAPASSNIQSMDKRLSLMRFIIEKHLPSYQAHLADALLGLEAASIQRLSGWEAEIRQSLQDRQPLSDASRDFLAHPSYGDGGMAAAVRLRSEIPDNA